MIPGMSKLVNYGFVTDAKGRGKVAKHNDLTGPGLRTFAIECDLVDSPSLKAFSTDLLAGYASSVVVVDRGETSTLYGAAYIPQTIEEEVLRWADYIEPEEGQGEWDKALVSDEITFPSVLTAFSAMKSSLGISMSGEAIEPKFITPMVAPVSLGKVRGNLSSNTFYTDSPALEAGCALITAQKSEKCDIVAHVCLLSFLSGEDDDLELLESRVEEWERLVRDSKGFARAGVMSSIQASVSYLETFRYRATSDRSETANRVIRLAEGSNLLTKRVVRTRILRLADALPPDELLSLRGQLDYDQISSGELSLPEILSRKDV
jgi:hypothetical protein